MPVTDPASMLTVYGVEFVQFTETIDVAIDSVPEYVPNFLEDAETTHTGWTVAVTLNEAAGVAANVGLAPGPESAKAIAIVKKASFIDVAISSVLESYM